MKSTSPERNYGWKSEQYPKVQGCISPKLEEDCQTVSYPLSYRYERETAVISKLVKFDLGG